MSRTKIQTVTPGSPAHRAGVRPGETLAAINGHPIIDVLDYKFYSYDPDLVLTLREGDAERKVFLDKDVGQDLGLEFETYLMDRARSCANNCVFCFVDQMPQGMRETLYFKDDDARLSFLMGNYTFHPSTSPSTPRIQKSGGSCWATSGGGASAWRSCRNLPRRASP